MSVPARIAMASDSILGGDPSLTLLVSAVEDILDRWTRRESEHMQQHRRKVEDILVHHHSRVAQMLSASLDDEEVDEGPAPPAAAPPPLRPPPPQAPAALLDEDTAFCLPSTKPETPDASAFLHDAANGGTSTATGGGGDSRRPSDSSGFRGIVPDGGRDSQRSTLRKTTLKGADTFADKLHKIRVNQRIPEMEGILDWQHFSEIPATKREACRWLKLDKLKWFVEHRFFTSTVTLLIMLNAVFIGAHTDHAVGTHLKRLELGSSVEEAKSDLVPEWIRIGDLSFMVLFTLELALRLLAYEGEYFTGPESRWNIFDLVLVITAIAEKVIDFMNLSFLRVLRALRALRALRVIRAMRFFRELRMMLLAVWGSMVPVCWALCFILLVKFLVSIIVLNGLSEYLGSLTTQDEIYEASMLYFFSVPMTLLSLFMCISGGQDWWEIGQPLLKLGLFYGLVFILFIFVVLFGVLNVITGFFVESALEICKSDRDLLVQSAIKHEDLYLQSLRELFHEFDSDGSGTISFPEFQEHLKSRQVQAYFKSLGLDAAEAIMLFFILDTDQSGSIGMNEFVTGCARLQGQARTVDIAGMMSQNKLELNKVVAALDEVIDQVHGISGSVAAALETGCRRRSSTAAKRALANAPAGGGDVELGAAGRGAPEGRISASFVPDPHMIGDSPHKSPEYIF
eukprot:TRINITY_DN12836_c0_g5_i1.p2 TRINITY_DN12836_c0_g5~~TRINITY_DN12836_c0_g5_i1.p2  ORF type:complete len:683 (+),score=147.78 TRINITY_DN12836_c0_g5_i1:2108-4156(+)